MFWNFVNWTKIRIRTRAENWLYEEKLALRHRVYEAHHSMIKETNHRWVNIKFLSAMFKKHSERPRSSGYSHISKIYSLYRFKDLTPTERRETVKKIVISLC